MTKQKETETEKEVNQNNVLIDAKIAELVSKLTGEVQALTKCWVQLQQLLGQGVPSGSDILEMVALWLSVLLGTVNRIRNTSDQLRTLISTSKGSYSILPINPDDEKNEQLELPGFEDGTVPPIAIDIDRW